MQHKCQILRRRSIKQHLPFTSALDHAMQNYCTDALHEYHSVFESMRCFCNKIQISIAKNVNVMQHGEMLFFPSFAGLFGIQIYTCSTQIDVDNSYKYKHRHQLHFCLRKQFRAFASFSLTLSLSIDIFKNVKLLRQICQRAERKICKTNSIENFVSIKL